jgi:hypothetical protein
LEQKVHNAEVDLNYTLYYPLLKPYVALFRGSERENTQSAEPGQDGADEAAKKEPNHQEESKSRGNVEIWKEVEKAMKKGTAALDSLRNWKPERKVNEVIEKKSEKKKGKEDKKKAGPGKEGKAAVPGGGDGESDDGFFE